LNFDKNNLLEVTVSKMSADPSVNNAERLADYWVFGGIYRPVFLEAKPIENIRQVSIDAKSSGDFKMEIIADHIKKAKNISVAIKDAKGNLI
jgi:beta-galactosidase/beta-glucuronidase